jgi:hypothetical protein
VNDTRCVGNEWCDLLLIRPLAPFFLLLSLQVGSFFAIHFVANLLVTVAAVLYSCESSGFYAMFLFTYLGVSVVGVNVLGHRCVHEHTSTPLSRALVLLIFSCLFSGPGTLVVIPGT